MKCFGIDISINFGCDAPVNPTLSDAFGNAIERLGHYELALWREAKQTLFMLELLRWTNRRKAAFAPTNRRPNPRIGRRRQRTSRERTRRHKIGNGYGRYYVLGNL